MSFVVPEMLSRCLNYDHAPPNQHSLLLDFIRLSHADRGFLAGLLLISCRYMCRFHRRHHPYQDLATTYKLDCLRSLSQSIAVAPSAVSDATIAKAIVLAQDEVCVCAPLNHGFLFLFRFQKSF